jgi:hypothetical protein
MHEMHEIRHLGDRDPRDRLIVLDVAGKLRQFGTAHRDLLMAAPTLGLRRDAR